MDTLEKIFGWFVCFMGIAALILAFIGAVTSFGDDAWPGDDES